ncbi:Malonyl CoA-acyl carrier protein transacylase [Ceratocystis fimbriata CBS 114723]|uniref:[acyl-carrier-protein] S-malonyltransferase n=1 Tax=Ceratocystis fimbriata CBS 114723 TaxID=1035309 RepID=A0A2C5WWH4_9PEZI|nr:Malonyl CoA-acyl carrier protein transacylase [Ceratocystis fimbriata CBS 114723]
MSVTNPVVRRLLASRSRSASHLRSSATSASDMSKILGSPRPYISSPGRSKTAMFFPGQGVQRVGMLSPWLYAFPSTSREFIDELDSCMGYKFSDIIQSGPSSRLNATVNAQPAIMATSLLILRILERNFNFNTSQSIDYTLGHSLGEFAALVAGGYLSFQDSLRIVHRRAAVMADATERAEAATPGSTYGMVAIITEPEYLASLIHTISSIVGENVCDWSHTPFEGQVCIANVNSKNQIVLSGSITGISRVLDRVRLFSGHDPQALRLNSDTPFHSPLMRPAGEAVYKMLSRPGTIAFPGRIQCISNISARPFNSPEELADLVSRAGVEPVRWADSIRYLNEKAQVRRWIGIGPGQVGRNLVGKEIGIRGTDRSRNAGVWGISKPEDIDEVLRGLEDTDSAMPMPISDFAVQSICGTAA